MRPSIMGPNNVCDLFTTCKILEKVKAYAKAKGYKNVTLCTIEDNSMEDIKNGRWDIEIMHSSESGQLFRQKLLWLKGELLDGIEFHNRFTEFYPDNEGGELNV